MGPSGTRDHHLRHVACGRRRNIRATAGVEESCTQHTLVTVSCDSTFDFSPADVDVTYVPPQASIGRLHSTRVPQSHTCATVSCDSESHSTIRDHSAGHPQCASLSLCALMVHPRNKQAHNANTCGFSICQVARATLSRTYFSPSSAEQSYFF